MPTFDVLVADLARRVPVARADVDEAAGERVDLVARQLPERAREVHAALRERDGRGELDLVERVGVGDRRAWARACAGTSAASPISSGVSSSDTRPSRAFVFHESGAHVAGACLRIVLRQSSQARRPEEGDAVAARTGAPRRRVAERRAEARALGHERGVEGARRAVLDDGVGDAPRDRGDVERVAAGRAPQALGAVGVAHLDAAAGAALERLDPGVLGVALTCEQPQRALGARQRRGRRGRSGRRTYRPSSRSCRRP